MRKVHVVSAISLLTIGAATAAADAPAPQPPLSPAGTFIGGASVDGRPRGGYMIDGNDPQPLPPPDVNDGTYHAPIIFYVNFNGGTYVPGNNDSRTNRSSIVDQTSSVPAWNATAAGKQQVMSCMTTMFARWNILVTDVDPGNVPHYEIVTAGRPQDIGMEAGVGGVSPFNCGTIQNSIVFTFAAIYGTDYRGVCETNAQEIVHSFGADHEHLCQDPMTYLTGCGNKSFQNVAAPCGEYSNRACQCGGNTQNSVALLDQRVGLAQQPPMVDAGVPPSPDAGPTPAPDAGTTPPGPDAGPTPSTDGGSTPPSADAATNPGDPDAGPAGSDLISGGCGCASGSSGGASPHLLLAIAVLLFVRSRSRASRTPRTSRTRDR